MKAAYGLIVLLLLGLTTDACAAVRAWLDRDHLALGDSVTLTIESDGSFGQPNLAPLSKDFDSHGVSTGSQTTIVNGSMKTSTQWVVTLVPRHSGAIEIPALAVGGERTLPLHLGVDARAAADATAPASPTPNSHADGRGPVFIESAIEPLNPYVQQASIYSVRMYYAVTLLDGNLEVPPPEHGDLRQIGDDVRSSVITQDRRYEVIERHYLLQPERSGALRIPAPGFQGRTMPNFGGAFDDNSMTGTDGGIRAVGKPLDVQVRARPQQASDPWVPARALELGVDSPTTPPRAGEPFSIVVKMSSEGTTAAQLPEIVLPAIPGAQVYPEPSTTSERIRGGNLQAERTRRFAIVPDHAGDLRLPALEVPWWNVVDDRAAIARLALPDLKVLPGSIVQNDVGVGPSARVATTSNPSAESPAQSANTGVVRAWQIATASLAVLFVMALWWGWRRGKAGIDAHEIAEGPIAHLPRQGPTLTRALASGDVAAIAQALLEAQPARNSHNLGDVARRLDDPAQRAAVLALDAARWSANGTLSAPTLGDLRTAFARPIRWIEQPRSRLRDDPLPPLYPS